MQTTEIIRPIIAVEPQKLVSSQLLKEVQGDVLLIYTAYATAIFQCTAEHIRQNVVLRFATRDTENVSFIAGKMSDRGGRFKVVSRNQAIELIGTWILKEVI